MRRFFTTVSVTVLPSTNVIGFKVPPIIRTHEAVKAKLQLLEALADIQVALKILSDGDDGDKNPIDRRYSQLKVDIQHLKQGTCLLYTSDAADE